MCVILKHFLKMNSLQPPTKKLRFVQTFFYVQYVAKSGIADIIIVHPLAKKNRQIM